MFSEGEEFFKGSKKEDGETLAERFLGNMLEHWWELVAHSKVLSWAGDNISEA